MAGGYFRARLAQERLVQADPIPYTVVCGTQFIEFVPGIVPSATIARTMLVAPVLMQPIDARDAAAVLAEVSLAAPRNGMLELAGPEPIRQDDLVRPAT